VGLGEWAWTGYSPAQQNIPLMTLKAPWPTGSGAAFLCAFLGLACLAFDPLAGWLRHLSFDLPCALRPDRPLPPSEVLIVAMDDQSLNRMRLKTSSPTNAPWSRAWHAQMLEKALALGAQGVVFDILFKNPGPDPNADRLLAQTILNAPGKVVLGAQTFQYEEGKKNGGSVLRTETIPPAPPLAGTAPSGIVEFPIDGPDGTIRRPYTAPNDTLLSLAQAAAQTLQTDPGNAPHSPWMHYYGPRGTLPVIRFDQLLEQPDQATNLFLNKVLFVGLNPPNPGQQDEHRTSYTRWTGETVSGVEVHATAYVNLVRNDWIMELSAFWEWILIVGGGSLLGVAISRLRPGLAVVLGIGAALALTLAACVLFWKVHVWFPWSALCLVQIPLAITWSLVLNTQRLTREKGQLETLLAGQVSLAKNAHLSARDGSKPEIPDHELVRCVGRGAYGEVWLARDVIGTYHAVKVVHRNRFSEDTPFQREFHGIQKFTPISRQHPGWVQILHVGRNDGAGYFYYVMELGDDQSSGQQIEPASYLPRDLALELKTKGPLPLPQVIQWGLCLAEALQYLHDHQLIHRDIKPSNVIFVRGHPKFTDIGLVTDMKTMADVSRLGTESYMAPEGPGTPAADVFSLGKVLYEMACGRDVRAFPEMPTFMLEEEDHHASHRLYRILLQACCADAAQRHPTAEALKSDLLALQQSM